MPSQKIVNDPVHGFITIKSKLILDVINHPYFQRLRRIKQLGLTDLVYPGALHTRFHHALGAMHLMSIALDMLRDKGHHISDKEYESSLLAILLHDIGHAPFSHALEYTLLKGVHHEHLSAGIMRLLNQAFDGKLSLAIQIFEDTYHRHFFHQLVSSQLDMDRLDYLQRDVYFTGVIEGKVGFDRIIRMLDVVDDTIVVEEKGIYSIENFLNARRLMYWQVYLHKTTLSAEQMLIKIMARAQFLYQSNQKLPVSDNIAYFLEDGYTSADINEILQRFVLLDDYDIWGNIKVWQNYPDIVLQTLCKMLLSRNLFKTILAHQPFDITLIESVSTQIENQLTISKEEAAYLWQCGQVSNAGYVSDAQNILIRKKDGSLLDVTQASDLPNLEALSKVVTKYYICCPRFC